MTLRKDREYFASNVQDEDSHTFCPIALAADVEYPDHALVTHALLGDADDLLIVLAERDPLHGGGKLPPVQAFARLEQCTSGSQSADDVEYGCVRRIRLTSGVQFSLVMERLQRGSAFFNVDVLI